MMNDEAIPMRRRNAAEVEYAPRNRDGRKYAEALDDFERIKGELEQTTQELDRMRNALHVSELKNVELTARVKELDHRIELNERRAAEIIDDLKDRNSRITTRLKAGAEQFLAALRENNEQPLLADIETRALAAVEAALPDSELK
jgi:F0F1-type ATP synthase membrane subunit b/b'